MVDFQRAFINSYNLLLRDKQIIFPALASMIVIILLITLALYSTGFLSLFREFYSSYEAFLGQKSSYIKDTGNMRNADYPMEMFKYMASEYTSNDFYEEDFDEFLQGSESGLAEKAASVFSFRNIVLLNVFVAIGMLAIIYFGAMSSEVVALAMNKKNIGFLDVIKATNAVFFRYFLYILITSLIFALPILFLLLISVLLSVINPVFVLVGVLLFLGYAVYAVFFGLKLYFSIPALFVDNLPAVASLKKSFSITKGKIGMVFFVYGVTYATSFVVSSFGLEPLVSSYANVLLSSNILTVFVSALLVILFFALGAVAFTFLTIFQFYMYVEFKNMVKVDDKSKIA